MYFNKIAPSVVVVAIAYFFAPNRAAAQQGSPASSAATSPKSHRMPMAYRFTYQCEGGTTLSVYLRGQRLSLTFKDKSYSMKQVEAASGTRYSDGKIVWWSKGYDGFLQDETNPSQPVALAENCKQTAPPPAKEAAQPAKPAGK